jgi:hypothetical protein
MVGSALPENLLEKLRPEAGKKNTEMERRNNFGDMDWMTPV